MRKYSIKFIIVYFGSLPFWMPAFLRSCQMNPDVEWLLYTDAPVPAQTPANVKFIKMNIQSFNLLCQQKIGLKNVGILPSFPYKLCDFKPAYGAIFEDYLQDCDFWGHCDIDVIWGDIRKFFNRHVLSAHDIVTTRPGRVSGHCCLYRNKSDFKNLYRRIPHSLAMLQDSENHYAMDERHVKVYLRSILYPSLLRRLQNRLGINKHPAPRIYWEKHLTTRGRQQLDMAAKNGCFWWQDGKVYDMENNEMMYIHFHRLRRSMQSIDFSYSDAVTSFAITTRGFYSQYVPELINPESVTAST